MRCQRPVARVISIVACCLLCGGEVLAGDGPPAAPPGTWINYEMPTQPDTPRGVVVADFDEDGLPDIATGTVFAFLGDAGISILDGRGDGWFDTPRQIGGIGTYDSPVAHLRSADFDGDGHADLVTAHGARSTRAAPSG